jgi:predicted small metal-binding protein
LFTLFIGSRFKHRYRKEFRSLESWNPTKKVRIIDGGDTRMGYTLACKDLGTTCPYVTHAETLEELKADGAKHAKEVHGYTDEKLNNPEFAKAFKAAIKKE